MSIDPQLLGALRCPECRGTVNAIGPEELRCTRCERRYAVHQGVPVFTDTTSKTSAAFGYLWGQETDRVAPPQAPTRYHLHELHDALGAPRLAGLIVDGGCGDGIDLAMLALEPGCEVVGVELSDGGVATSLARTRGLPRARVVQADLLKLPLADNTFDGGYSYGVVHHTDDPPRAVRELARVIKPKAPLLFYVYEDFSDRPLYWRLALHSVNLLRHVTTRLPSSVLMITCRLMSPLVYATCTLPSRHFRFAARFPYRHGKGPWGLSGDLYDRFSAPVERRYSEAGACALAEQAGLRVIRSAQRRGWMIWAEKEEQGG
jgi:SAM-dependent methyltransferase